MSRATFKLESWFLDELLSRLHDERDMNSANRGPLRRSVLDREKKEWDKDEYGEHSVPSREDLETLLQNVFWASLQKEEGQSLKFSAGYLRPIYDYDYFLTFDKPLPLEIKRIAKLAPAVKEMEAAMLVYPDDNGSLSVWGITDFNPALLTIKVLESGRLVVSFNTKNIAVITGYESVFINDVYRERTRRIWSKLTPNPRGSSEEDDRVSLLTKALGNIRSSGRGGTIIVVPDDGDWRAGFGSLNYFGRSPLRTPHNLAKEWADLCMKKGLRGALAKLQRMVELFLEFDRVPGIIAQLSDVDGAVVCSRDLDVLGFGAKIKYDPQNSSPSIVYRFDSMDDVLKPVPVSLNDLGGMRHQSAAHFVTCQHEALALVASQDGILSAFVWEDEQEGGGYLAEYTRLELAIL